MVIHDFREGNESDCLFFLGDGLHVHRVFCGEPNGTSLDTMYDDMFVINMC